MERSRTQPRLEAAAQDSAIRDCEYVVVVINKRKDPASNAS